MFGRMGVSELILFVIIQGAIIAIPVLAIRALWRFVKAYERRSAQPTELRDRVLRVEESTGEISDRLEKLAEEQQFLTRLLSERSKAGARTDT